MKYILILIFLLNFNCNKSDLIALNCIKAKLVLQGLCMNYVIQIIEGNVDSSLFETIWINPITNVNYQNVFGLGSICTFPSTIKEGDEFYFTISKEQVIQTCPQCQAYSPTPNKKIAIQICNK